MRSASPTTARQRLLAQHLPLDRTATDAAARCGQWTHSTNPMSNQSRAPQPTGHSHAAISIVVVGRWLVGGATRGAALARSRRRQRPASATARPTRVAGAIGAAATAAPILAPRRHRAGGRPSPGRQWAGDDLALRPFPRREAQAACEAGGWELNGVGMNPRLLDLSAPSDPNAWTHCIAHRSVATPRHRPPPAGMVPCASSSTARSRTAASSTPPRANGGWVRGWVATTRMHTGVDRRIYHTSAIIGRPNITTHNRGLGCYLAREGGCDVFAADFRGRGLSRSVRGGCRVRYTYRFRAAHPFT